MDLKDTDPESNNGLKLVKGKPAYMSEEEVKDLGITDNNQEGDLENQQNEMKCPNCGISVKSGWFLCPACKSPLN